MSPRWWRLKSGRQKESPKNQLLGPDLLRLKSISRSTAFDPSRLPPRPFANGACHDDPRSSFSLCTNCGSGGFRVGPAQHGWPSDENLNHEFSESTRIRPKTNISGSAAADPSRTNEVGHPHPTKRRDSATNGPSIPAATGAAAPHLLPHQWSKNASAIVARYHS